MTNPLKNYNFLGGVLTAAAATLALTGTSFPGSWIIGFLWVIFLGHSAGRAFFKDESPGWSKFLGSLTVLLALALQGAVVYRLADLKPIWCAALITVTGFEVILASLIMSDRNELSLFGRRSKKRDGRRGGLTGSLVAATVTVICLSLLGDLASVATEEAARSPWDIAPSHFLTIFGLAVLLVIGCSLGGWLANAAPWALAVTGLTAVSVALKTYSVGFGFDPFIHRATETAILEHGLILPKPFYYLGQYAFVVIGARTTGLPIVTLDSWLVPVLVAMLLPLAWWSIRRSLKISSGAATWAAASLLMLPLGSFIMTTPQGVANALAAATGFLVLPAVTTTFPLWPALLAALTVASVHPITGIPVMVMVVAAALSGHVSRLSPRWRIRLGVALAFFGAASLPGLFILNSYLSGTAVSFDPSPLWKPWLFWERLSVVRPPSRLFSPLLDFAYSWLEKRNLTLLLLAGAGFYPLARRRSVWPFAVAGGSAVFAYVMLRVFLGFDFLISYEQDDYANRLWPIALLLLAPAVATAVGLLAERLRSQAAHLKIVAAALLVAVTVSSVYLAYPRRDQHDPSRGWSTSRLDIEAVNLIEKDADGHSYVVLANQSVSAAAIKEFGFSNRYVHAPYTPEGELYFYPVPTSSPLYDKFLAMNQARGHRRLADLTLNWLGVERLYYVVSFYWYGAGEIVPLARKQADQTWNLENDVYIFRYDRK